MSKIYCLILLVMFATACMNPGDSYRLCAYEYRIFSCNFTDENRPRNYRSLCRDQLPHSESEFVLYDQPDGSAVLTMTGDPAGTLYASLERRPGWTKIRLWDGTEGFVADDLAIRRLVAHNDESRPPSRIGCAAKALLPRERRITSP